MDVKTKYNVKDEVYVIKGNATKAKIVKTSVSFIKVINQDSIYYAMKFGSDDIFRDDRKEYAEEDVYPTLGAAIDRVLSKD